MANKSVWKGCPEAEDLPLHKRECCDGHYIEFANPYFKNENTTHLVTSDIYLWNAPCWWLCDSLSRDLGLYYNFTMIFLFLWNVFCFIRAQYKLYLHKTSGKGKEAGLDMHTLLFTLVITGTFSRIFLYLDPQPESKPFFVSLWRTSQAGSGFYGFCLKFGQVAILVSCSLMIVVWSDIVESTRSLKKSEGAARMQRYTLIFISFFAAVVFPIYSVIYLIQYIRILELAGNIVFSLYTLGIWIFQTYYGFHMHKLVSSMKTEAGRQTCRRIRNFAVMLSLSCASVIVSATWMGFQTHCSEGGSELYIVLFCMIHVPEVMMYHMIIFALEKNKQAKKKLHASRASAALRTSTADDKSAKTTKVSTKQTETSSIRATGRTTATSSNQGTTKDSSYVSSGAGDSSYRTSTGSTSASRVISSTAAAMSSVAPESEMESSVIDSELEEDE